VGSTLTSVCLAVLFLGIFFHRCGYLVKHKSCFSCNKIWKNPIPLIEIRKIIPSSCQFSRLSFSPGLQRGICEFLRRAGVESPSYRQRHSAFGDGQKNPPNWTLSAFPGYLFIVETLRESSGDLTDIKFSISFYCTTFPSSLPEGAVDLPLRQYTDRRRCPRYNATETDAKVGVSFFTSLHVNIKIHAFILFEFIAKRGHFNCKPVLLCVGVGKPRSFYSSLQICTRARSYPSSVLWLKTGRFRRRESVTDVRVKYINE